MVVVYEKEEARISKYLVIEIHRNLRVKREAAKSIFLYFKWYNIIVNKVSQTQTKASEASLSGVMLC